MDIRRGHAPAGHVQAHGGGGKLQKKPTLNINQLVKSY
jgi:hypothetical protein